MAVPDLTFLEQRIRNEPAQHWRYQTCIGTIQPIDGTAPLLTFTLRADLGVLARFCTVDCSDEFALTQARVAVDDGEVSIF